MRGWVVVGEGVDGGRWMDEDDWKERKRDE